MPFRIAWFNLENLFSRYAFAAPGGDALGYERQRIATGVTSIERSADGREARISLDDAPREHTARVILDMQPDILGVAEVETLTTLRLFNQQHLDHYFDRLYLIEGNDPRGINVALCLRRGFDARVLGLRSHAHETVMAGQSVRWGSLASPEGPLYQAQHALFSRDCLELDIEIRGHTLCLLANHFKSQGRSLRPEPLPPDLLRRQQAERVAQLVQTAREQGKRPIVLGDLNVDIDQPRGQSIAPLFAIGLHDPYAALPAAERWTHYYMSTQQVSRLDYILHDPALRCLEQSIHRQGLPGLCHQYSGPRYPGIGPLHNAASDHAGLCITLALPDEAAEKGAETAAKTA